MTSPSITAAPTLSMGLIPFCIVIAVFVSFINITGEALALALKWAALRLFLLFNGAKRVKSRMPSPDVRPLVVMAFPGTYTPQDVADLQGTVVSMGTLPDVATYITRVKEAMGRFRVVILEPSAVAMAMLTDDLIPFVTVFPSDEDKESFLAECKERELTSSPA